MKFSFFLEYASISKQKVIMKEWESKRSKYDQIKSKFCESYPEVEDEKFPCSSDLDFITKERVPAKLKPIRTNF